MSRLVSWKEYQDVRRKLAEYNNVLVFGQPKEDLSNDEVNDIFIPELDPCDYNTVAIAKSRHNPFYRDIRMKKSVFSIEDYFLIKPSTMPKENIINSILSWEIRSGHMNNTLSQEDRKKYPWLITVDLDTKLRRESDYRDLYTEV